MTADVWKLILEGLLETLEMTVVSTIFAYVVGLPLGILLYITANGRIGQNRILNIILATVTNIFRSIPFLILLVFLIPFTRFIVGTSLGTTATIVPLTVGAIPIVARLVEQSLNEVPSGIVEAAQSMGASNMQIIWKVMLLEARSSLLNGAAVATITILGYSAMAGTLGGGGLGDIAIRYGHYRFQPTIMWITIVVLVVLVQILQEIGVKTAQKLDNRIN